MEGGVADAEIGTGAGDSATATDSAVLRQIHQAVEQQNRKLDNQYWQFQLQGHQIKTLTMTKQQDEAIRAFHEQRLQDLQIELAMQGKTSTTDIREMETLENELQEHKLRLKASNVQSETYRKTLQRVQDMCRGSIEKKRGNLAGPTVKEAMKLMDKALDPEGAGASPKWNRSGAADMPRIDAGYASTSMFDETYKTEYYIRTFILKAASRADKKHYRWVERNVQKMQVQDGTNYGAIRNKVLEGMEKEKKSIRDPRVLLKVNAAFYPLTNSKKDLRASNDIVATWVRSVKAMSSNAQDAYFEAYVFPAAHVVAAMKADQPY